MSDRACLGERKDSYGYHGLIWLPWIKGLNWWYLLRTQSHKHCLIQPAAMKQCTKPPVHWWSNPCLKTPLEPPFTYCCGLVQVMGADKKNRTQFSLIKQRVEGWYIFICLGESCKVEMIFRRLKKRMLQKDFGKGATVAKWVLRQSARMVQGGSQWCAVRDASTRLTLGPSFPYFCTFFTMTDYFWHGINFICRFCSLAWYKSLLVRCDIKTSCQPVQC